MASLKKISVREVYFYLIAFISLLIVLSATGSILTTTLRYYLLNTAPAYSYQPPFFLGSVGETPTVVGPYGDMKSKAFQEQEQQNNELVEAIKTNQSLTNKQHQQVEDWLSDYTRWKEDQENQRNRLLDSLIGKFVSLLIFTPVFAFHYRKTQET